MILPMALLQQVLHSKFGRSFHLQSLAPSISTFVIGGLFGLAFLPLLSFYLILKLEKCHFFFYYVPKDYIVGIIIILFLQYIITVLISDKSHHQIPVLSKSNNSTKSWKLAQQFMKAHFDYFPMTCLPWSPNAKLPLSQKYIFAVHPHGIHCWPLNMFSFPHGPFDTLFPGLVGQKLIGLAASIVFYLPIVRELFLSMRYIDASRSIANKALSKGYSIFVCTGGEQESLHTTIGEDFVVLSNRKGFIRLALSHGAHIVPVFGIGVNDLYQTYTYGHTFRRYIQSKFGIAIPIFHGRWFTPLPYKRPIQVLIGKPIPTPTPKIEGVRPDETLVQEYHEKYIQAVKDLHETHVKDRTLKIV